MRDGKRRLKDNSDCRPGGVPAQADAAGAPRQLELGQGVVGRVVLNGTTVRAHLATALIWRAPLAEQLGTRAESDSHLLCVPLWDSLGDIIGAVMMLKPDRDSRAAGAAGALGALGSVPTGGAPDWATVGSVAGFSHADQQLIERHLRHATAVLEAMLLQARAEAAAEDLIRRSTSLNERMPPPSPGAAGSGTNSGPSARTDPI